MNIHIQYETEEMLKTAYHREQNHDHSDNDVQETPQYKLETYHWISSIMNNAPLKNKEFLHKVFVCLLTLDIR